jgi:hypothetical protein
VAFNKLKSSLKQKETKVGKVMGEFKKGALKTAAGKPITDRKQAIAISLSEAGLSNKNKKKRS